MSSNETSAPTGAPSASDIISTLDSGDTVWVLVSAMLIFLMTPGLAFFYGGLAHQKVVLNTIMMSMACAGLIIVQWSLIGFSLAFGGRNDFIGGGFYMGLSHLGFDPAVEYTPKIPSGAFWYFQLTFAILTPALISGSVVGRMRFRSWVVFVLLWATFVYDPVAHWVWSAWTDDDGVVQFGWLRALGCLDFAGGTVVHIISGFSGLVACIMLGPRNSDEMVESGEMTKNPKRVEDKPHNVPFVLLGASLLWFGWNGFNGGSALVVDDGLAVQAVMNTNIATGAGFLTWMALDAVLVKKISAAGSMMGCVAGLVGITPGCGFVHLRSSLFIGAATSFAVYFSVKLKDKLKYDDSLDAFGGHGMGGVVGCLLTGLFAQKEINPYGADGLFWGGGKLFGVQILSVVVAAAYSSTMTALIILLLKHTVGIRVSTESEKLGVDEASHGTQAYYDKPGPGGVRSGAAAAAGAAKSNTGKESVPLQPTSMEGDQSDSSQVDGLI